MIMRIKMNIKKIKVTHIFALLGLALVINSNRAQAQVVVGHQPDKPVDKSHSLLELKVDNSKDTAQAFMLPLAKTSQRDKITNYNQSGSQSNTTQNGQKFPRGGMLYDVTAGKITVHVQKDDKTGNEWRYLAYLSEDTAVPVLIARDSSAITLNNNSGGSNTSQTITISSPEGYVPYTYNRKTNPNGGFVRISNNQQTSSRSSPSTDSVVVSLSYNGYTLTPYEDYKAEIETQNSGGGDKVKITFLSFVPEHKQDFDKVFVQYVRKQK